MRSTLLFALSLLAATSVAAKDLALQQHVTSSVGTSYDATEYRTPSLYVVDGPHSRTVIDAKAQTVLVVDKDEKTIWKSTFESLRKQVEEADAHPPELTNPRAAVPITLNATTSTETIAGHPAVEHTFTGGIPTGSVWLAKDLESPADPELWKTWQGLGRMLGPSGKLTDVVMTKGVPLRTVTTMTLSRRPLTITTEVTAVREEAPPAALLADPEGYTQRHFRNLAR